MFHGTFLTFPWQTVKWPEGNPLLVPSKRGTFELKNLAAAQEPSCWIPWAKLAMPQCRNAKIRTTSMMSEVMDSVDFYGFCGFLWILTIFFAEFCYIWAEKRITPSVYAQSLKLPSYRSCKVMVSATSNGKVIYLSLISQVNCHLTQVDTFPYLSIPFRPRNLRVARATSQTSQLCGNSLQHHPDQSSWSRSSLAQEFQPPTMATAIT